MNLKKWFTILQSITKSFFWQISTSNIQIKKLISISIITYYFQVYMECAGHSQPLFAIKGCVLGMEINIDTTAIPFGSVFRNSSTSKKIVMSNSGDMNAKYVYIVMSLSKL